ncbi:M13 family metallopeptidase [Sphingomonas bacterium]|uniref:M13 family metallopeptidase n=1 Tax=Sphingomonas bacterium TaxID=1895847 RepID=UPI001575C6D4|nr:M13-type metalloendopeptidase [Sphingomonas bacterium]
MRQPVLAALLFASASTLAVAQTAPAPTAAAAPSTKPQYGDFGIDLAGRDASVAPGDDFYDYASGTWAKGVDIPADKTAFGMFNVLDDLSRERTKAILEAAAQRPGDKIGDFYTSFNDVATVEAKGLAPVKPWLDRIAAARTKGQLVATMAYLSRYGVPNIIGVGVGVDDKDPNSYAVGINQGGLGLPDRDYYLKDDPQLATVRTAYQAYLARMLTLAGETGADARAAAVYGLEKQIAQVHWTRIESRDADKTYNQWTAVDFTIKAPGFPWADYANQLGMGNQRFYLVSQPSAITGEATVFANAPLPVLQDLLRLRVLRSYAAYLPKRFDDANFAFYGTALSGVPEQQVRWKRSVGVVSGSMGEAIGQQYVDKYFPPESKSAADQLVKNIIAAMGARIDKLEWMAPETKVKAHAKLAAFTPKIGYPDKFRDYSALQITRDDLVGNVARADEFEFNRELHKLGTPMDRSEWGMTPMTINAYANPTWNEIVFPAAILQPPFFDAKADPAVNYGAIGAVIGHELSHHFDDQGRKYDPTGKLADWWTPTDVARFKTFTDKLVAQYDSYEPIPGQHIQGGLTLGENIADLAGLTVSLDAYHRSLNGKRAPVINGLTGDQRFYLGWAQVWRIKEREAALRSQLLSDPHSPDHERVLTVRNLDPWYAAFNVKPGAKMYLTPEQRVRIW